MEWMSEPGRSPRFEMSAADAVELVDSIENAGIDIWLDGGWAVDAALGAQTRPHDDLDLVVELRNVETLIDLLRHQGFVVFRGTAPKSIEMTDSVGRQVDIHPVTFSGSGDGVYLMDDGDEWIYPAAGFTGTGRVLNREVRCLTPEVQVLCHAGYEPHRSSYDDVHALCGRFGIPVPREYRGQRESYPLRLP